MRAQLEAATKGHAIYAARRQEYDTGEKIPFRVSPKPFALDTDQEREIKRIGKDITGYTQAVDRLYRTNETVRRILDTGKPEILTEDRPTNYLFFRPDLIITPNGFSVCEIETSPFGLALAEILNRGYRQAGFETLVGDSDLTAHIHESTPTEGTILYSPKTQAYSGQMTFLADEVFSGEKRVWSTGTTSDRDLNINHAIYRGFYLSEYLADPGVRTVMESSLSNGTTISPSLTPHMEEKATLAFLWDKRFEAQLRKDLGNASFDHLREVIPPTWIVGQEAHFAPGLPDGAQTSIDLAKLSKSKRALVLKSSGFGNDASWAEGVHLLHKKSGAQAEALLTSAQKDPSKLHVIQVFHKAQDLPLIYEENGEHIPMMARVRMTPYYSPEGNLVAIKATGSPNNTDIIHASSNSINTAVSPTI